MKSTELKEFFFKIENEIEDTEEQPSSTLTKIYTDILYDNGSISDYELKYFEKDKSQINGFSFSEEEKRIIGCKYVEWITFKNTGYKGLTFTISMDGEAGCHCSSPLNLLASFILRKLDRYKNSMNIIRGTIMIYCYYNRCDYRIMQDMPEFSLKHFIKYYKINKNEIFSK